MTLLSDEKLVASAFLIQTIYLKRITLQVGSKHIRGELKVQETIIQNV